MFTIMIILIVFALACFIGAAFFRPSARPELEPLGLAFLTVALMLYILPHR